MKDRFTTLLVSRERNWNRVQFYLFIEISRDTKHSEKHKYKINIISYLSAIYHSVCAVFDCLAQAFSARNVKLLHDRTDGFDFHVWFTILVSDEKWLFKRLFPPTTIHIRFQRLLEGFCVSQSSTVAGRRCSWTEFSMHIANGLNALCFALLIADVNLSTVNARKL